MKLLILGGTKFVGPYLIEAAAERGHEMTIFTRGRQGYVAPPGAANANVDWDCDGYPFWMDPQSNYIDAGSVSADINGDGTIGVIPAALPEWPVLKYGSRAGAIFR